MASRHPTDFKYPIYILSAKFLAMIICGNTRVFEFTAIYTRRNKYTTKYEQYRFPTLVSEEKMAQKICTYPVKTVYTKKNYFVLFEMCFFFMFLDYLTKIYCKIYIRPVPTLQTKTRIIILKGGAR
eukprot:GEMP01062950.1.p1 GENE.GEMP01062950.1~~GEMP01062950.1.p1  ORF type:complete len:126 (+),score=2.37 GEMP01062950.1:269-646(+)